MLKLLAFTLPLCLDTFAVAFAVLGDMRLTRAQRLDCLLAAGAPLFTVLPFGRRNRSSSSHSSLPGKILSEA